jgi:hypothetical protein
MAEARTYLVVGALALALATMVRAAEVARGTVTVDREHPAWLTRAGVGPYFMCGPGDPEGFLYRDDQEALIEKLLPTGANCVYLIAVRSHGGDGGPQENPFVDHDPAKGLDEQVLQRWERWFSLMDHGDVCVYFFLYDDGAQPFPKDLIDGDLTEAEKRFVDTLVARFKHHRNLIWCVAEEYSEGLTRARASRVAARIKANDPHHPVAVHQLEGTSFDFRDDPPVDQFAIQHNVATAEELHRGCLAAWRDVGGRKSLVMSEFADAGTGPELRRKLWAAALGGAYVMVLGMDIARTPEEDLRACGHVVRFFEKTRFNECAPHDELAAGATSYVLARPGEVYIAYADRPGDLGLDLTAGRYELLWYDCVRGNWSPPTTVTLPDGPATFARPEGLGQEVCLYLTKSVSRRTQPGPSGASAAASVLPVSPAKGMNDMFEHVVVDADGPENPHIKTVGDLNGDGRDELVVASSAGGPLVWYDLANLSRQEIARSGKWSCDARLVDMDGDGDLDLVISEWYGRNRLEWYENPLPEGDPASGPWKRHEIGSPRAHDLCVADIDGDGRLEIVARQQGAAGAEIVVWWRSGPEQWQSRTLGCPAGEGLALGRLAGTGRLDIVIGGRWYETPAGLRASAGSARPELVDGRDGRWQEHVFADWFPTALVRVADVNGDGRPDVVLTRSEGEGKLSWFQAPDDPRARWTEHVVDDSLDYAHSLVVCDLSGDGTPDIVTAEMHQSKRRRVLVYLNEGRSTAWRREVVSTKGCHGLCLADLGELGKVLAGANWSGDYQPVEMWRVARHLVAPGPTDSAEALGP